MISALIYGLRTVNTQSNFRAMICTNCLSECDIVECVEEVDFRDVEYWGNDCCGGREVALYDDMEALKRFVRIYEDLPERSWTDESKKARNYVRLYD